MRNWGRKNPELLKSQSLGTFIFQRTTSSFSHSPTDGLFSPGMIWGLVQYWRQGEHCCFVTDSVGYSFVYLVSPTVVKDLCAVRCDKETKQRKVYQQSSTKESMCLINSCQRQQSRGLFIYLKKIYCQKTWPGNYFLTEHRHSWKRM